jgi:hypothetical protein
LLLRQSCKNIAAFTLQRRFCAAANVLQPFATDAPAKMPESPNMLHPEMIQCSEQWIAVLWTVQCSTITLGGTFPFVAAKEMQLSWETIGSPCQQYCGP